ncbi:MAG: hypothetical protein GY952_20455, partial [Rhodobacteraceae bacterium]|nr:hypothetical protein [Paracoccaceae bacterium]
LTNLDDGTSLADYQAAAKLAFELLPGKYKAEVLRTKDEATAEKTITIGTNTTTTVLLELPLFVPKASLTSPAEAPAGSTLQIAWTGPNEKSDFLSTAEVGGRPSQYVTYVNANKGTPATLRMPPIPGDYEIRYVHRDSGKAIARNTIKITPVTATISAEESGQAGALLNIEWTGPNYKNDYISVAEIGAQKGHYKNYTYTKKGTPLVLQLPIKPGNYELRYVMSQQNTVILRKPIKVEQVQATVAGPATAAAGSTVLVDWQGPGYKNDYISVAEVGAHNNKYENYSYTRDGSPLKLVMPAEPGDYEIRYVASQGTTVLARAPVRVEAIQAQITIPQSANIGEPLLVEWAGPDYKHDFISVAEVGSKDSKYVGYTYTREGSPLRLKLPLKPGDYEVRYVQNQDSTVLARQPLKIAALEAKLSASDTAVIGEPLLVQWEGPDYKNDYVSVAQTGQSDSKYVNYTYTREGSPMRLAMPVQPGEYEIRYIANGSPDTVLARRKITVEPVSASVTLVGEAQAGEQALVEWQGPDYRNDYIGVARIGAGKYETYTYTRDGSPLRVKMPDLPGSYELRYYLHQGGTVIASTPIEVR